MQIEFFLKQKNCSRSISLPSGEILNLTWNLKDEYPKPYPAKKGLQEWYKNTPKRKDNKQEEYARDKGGTIKNCMPVFDILSTGYIIPLVDPVSIEIDGNEIEYGDEGRLLFSGHVLNQYTNAPFEDEYVCKYDNIWVVKTPPGYSCLFTQPFYQSNKSFTMLPAIVDTDTYENAVAFPFTVKRYSKKIEIPKGYPMVQVIPFKREEWTHTIFDEVFEDKVQKITQSLDKTGIDAYKSLYWSKKSYE